MFDFFNKKRMWDFFIDYWAIIVAGLFAFASFLLINHSSQVKAKEANDQTINEMKGEFNSLLSTMEQNSTESMVAIKDAADKIIIDLKKDSENSTNEIKKETNKAIEEFQKVFDKLKEDTNILTNNVGLQNKELQFKEALVTLVFYIKDLEKFGVEENEFQKFIADYVTTFDFNLSVGCEDYKINYDSNDSEFYQIGTFGRIQHSFKNSFFIDPRAYPAREIVINFKVELASKANVSWEIKDLTYLLFEKFPVSSYTNNPHSRLMKKLEPISFSFKLRNENNITGKLVDVRDKAHHPDENSTYYTFSIEKN
ncbi:hypothetical protein KO529_07820 [Arenibacter algicola]|uniref:hypothetical protein n=1 Tax=Arenibacter algicola TaxID=616991 RepID=UPI001C065DCC|nr:hypothetical protein [Arenibacter algicola]MBU2904691.1 hypothetical protein [Arenibacter algicola]